LYIVHEYTYAKLESCNLYVNINDINLTGVTQMICLYEMCASKLIASAVSASYESNWRLGESV
jgi:hypothetical protein